MLVRIMSHASDSEPNARPIQCSVDVANTTWLSEAPRWPCAPPIRRSKCYQVGEAV